jgi:hypothetical protein
MYKKGVIRLRHTLVSDPGVLDHNGIQPPDSHNWCSAAYWQSIFFLLRLA